MVSPARAQGPARPLGELSLDELAEIEVTSVSRRPESMADAPASIFVITADDIRRSGASTLPEVLRLAPNLQVARIDAGQYAITARGFNGAVANKLLVLVDGRTIYTPLFSGVFWDQQDVMVEDIDRVEIISGPGAALWGANAVNGVINVITQVAGETGGVLASAAAGTRQQRLAFRYGRAVASHGAVRVYAKVTGFEHNWRADGAPVRDGRYMVQAGFRSDWGDPRRGFTLQGDTYRVRSQDRGNTGAVAIGRVELFGANLLARATRELRPGSELRVQAYVDHMHRDERVLFQPKANLFDVEIDYGMPAGAHRFVWGARYRHGTDDVRDGFLVGFRPRQSDQSWLAAYIHDEIRLTEHLDMTAGVRLARNDFTGWEYQPDARLAWKPAADQLVWGAVSRAVRAPARFDRDVIRPAGGVFGGPNFQAEVASVTQAGYRTRIAQVLTWSVTAYRHDWTRLRSATAPPVFFENKIEGPAYGLETWATWQALRAWRVSGGVTLLRKALRLEPGSTDMLGPENPSLSNDPGEQWMLRSSFTPWRTHDIDLLVRRVGALPHPIVPAYTAVDVRYGWRLRPDVELAVLGQNVFDRRHPEFNALPGRSEFERGVSVQMRWSH
jgi:iron complex outermembrane recepter protein